MSHGTQEFTFNFDGNQILNSPQGIFASTSNKKAPGAGDLYQRSGATWSLVLDSINNEMTVGNLGGTTYAAHGGEGVNMVVLEDSSGTMTQIATIVSAIPAAPGGWGLGEATYGYLFDLLGASAAIGVATSITFRLCQLLFSLLGGLFLLAPGSRADLKEVRDAAEK